MTQLMSTDTDTDTGLELVVTRRLVVPPSVAWFDLRPGDRTIVTGGEDVVPGTPLMERLRDPRLEVLPAQPSDADPGERRPGDRWEPTNPQLRRSSRRGPAARKMGPGELIYAAAGRWRLVTGDHVDLVESPLAGHVREVRSGVAIAIEPIGRAIPGAFVVGAATRGRLEIGIGGRGELRPGAIDVGRAGTILVVGSRVDAESLTRARAMGVQGIIVAALAGKELRDFNASEARQRAGLHRLPPFAVLVLDGALRRPISSPHMAILSALAGREVAIVPDPPSLIVGDPEVALPKPMAGWVRLRHGPHAGREGRWLGPAGLRRFEAGAHLEAGIVRFGEGPPVAVPLSDLERFA